MRISLHAHGFVITSAEREYVRTRLRFALGRFASRVNQVRVYLEDENASRGGVDKRCRAMAKLAGLSEVIIEDRDQCVSTLLDRVADRIGHTVGRRLERERFGKERIAQDGSRPSR